MMQKIGSSSDSYHHKELSSANFYPSSKLLQSFSKTQAIGKVLAVSAMLVSLGCVPAGILMAVLGISLVFYADRGADNGPVIDPKYGRASQRDPLLRSLGLISKKRNKLCGPACLQIVLQKFRIADGQKGILNQDAREIAAMVRTLMPLVAVPVQKLITVGMPPHKLARAGERLLRQKGIKASVQLVAREKAISSSDLRFDLNLLRRSILDDQAVILHIGRYSFKDPLVAALENQKSSHYIVVVGHDPKNPNKFYFRDPYHAQTIRSATLTRIEPESFVAPTYQLKFDDSLERWPTTLIRNVLLAQRQGQISEPS